MAIKPTNSAESTRALSAGLTFGITIALFTVGGVWLDTRLETKPLFVLCGVFCGLLGGTIHLLSALAPDILPFARRSDSPSGSRPDPGSRDPENAVALRTDGAPQAGGGSDSGGSSADSAAGDSVP